MILQALCDYYERKPDLPRLGFETKAIPFVIEIDAAGQLVQIEDTRTLEGKKKIARNFLMPQGVKKTSGVAANLLWDNAEYVLGVTSAGKPDRVQEQHAAFLAKLDTLNDKTDDAGLKAVRTFLQVADIARLEADPLWPEILEINPVMTFRLNGDLELVCQRPAVRAVLENIDTGAEEITCLISGEPDGFERLHTAIKGVWGAQTSGANIVSFNKDAFNSFGKEQGANAPVGKRAAFAYTTALNYLLSKESTQRIQVGDASTVFWSDKHTDLEDTFADLFDEPPKDNPAKQTDAIKALFKAPQTGALGDEGDKTRFYVLGLAPNAARISVRFWQVGTVAEMSARIRQHFDDLKIAHHEKLSPYLPLHSNRKNSLALLNSLVLDGDPSRVPPNLAGEFMRAILAGLPYPQTLLQAAVRRTHAESDVTYPRAALIKACLNRQARYSPPQEKEIAVALDENSTNTAYRLGRLFAVLERIQEEANPGIRATIRNTYWGAASGSPGKVFPLLVNLATKHISKIRREKPGRATNLEKLVGGIIDALQPDLPFPTTLCLNDQGRFIVGFYHQKQHPSTYKTQGDEHGTD
ncbi:MAG: type I-C CRISPR-associated protein Cas8c/Csd1 [Anaerolineales bacterium]|nr:type I-C CRISPR-associated protein Cas8c/Csd1 [Anaerolineales bacterium]